MFITFKSNGGFSCCGIMSSCSRDNNSVCISEQALSFSPAWQSTLFHNSVGKTNIFFRNPTRLSAWMGDFLLQNWANRTKTHLCGKDQNTTASFQSTCSTSWWFPGTLFLGYPPEPQEEVSSCLPEGWWTSSVAGHGGRSQRSKRHRCRSSPAAPPGETELTPESFSRHRSYPQYQPDARERKKKPLWMIIVCVEKADCLCANQHVLPFHWVGKWRWCLWGPAAHRRCRRSSRSQRSPGLCWANRKEDAFGFSRVLHSSALYTPPPSPLMSS